MDGLRSSAARFRGHDAIPLSGTARPEGGPEYLERPLPLDSAILWTPNVPQFPVDLAFPIFITQRALAAVHAHMAARLEGASSLGFLVGGVFQSTEAGIPYIVVESTIHIPWSISGDHLKPALLQGRAIAAEEVHRTGGQLLGWYHSHVGADARLSTADVGAHVACFDRPWQIALVMSRGAELTGGVFRIGPDGASANEYLPFYELAEGDSLLPDGRKVSDLAWTNYRTQDAVFSSDRVSHPELEAHPHLLFPDEVEADVPPAPAPRRVLVERAGRVARYGGLGVVALAALFGVYRAVASAPPSGAAPAATTAVTSDHVDRTADTVAIAVAAYDLRARLFDSRRMACADLARGLVDLEERWTAYNAARKGVAASLDAARNARDRALYSDVDAAERQFERSQCPRP
jgi:proteasome lid subunit RPN8/RPN11